MTPDEAKQRLEYLRGELRAERISYGELGELQSLVEYIEPGDVELLEAAGVPEFQDQAWDLQAAAWAAYYGEKTWLDATQSEEKS